MDIDGVYTPISPDRSFHDPALRTGDRVIASGSRRETARTAVEDEQEFFATGARGEEGEFFTIGARCGAMWNDGWERYSKRRT